MKYFDKVPAVLLLEDGTVYHGMSAGKIGTTTGEICFCTGMTGYQEVFTDPSYHGQILVMTNVHIGNYGVHRQEKESDSVKIEGLVCRNFTNLYSRKQAEGSLHEYFLDEDVIGISDVDTRSIVRHIRDKGAMNAIISSSGVTVAKLKEQLSKVPSMAGLELASEVSTKEPYILGKEKDQSKVAVLDYGIKQNILNCLIERGCRVQVYPAKTSFAEIEKWNPEGYFLSNGPGDPSAMKYAVELAKQVLEIDKPLFGICLGHQIICLANGLKTYKMHHGHRGINHPVKNLISGSCEITTQNHGFGVRPEEIEKHDKLEITHINLNDKSIEGIRVTNKKAFSVQYHPESTPGPHDSRYLFDEFVNMMKGRELFTSSDASISISAN
ncbi:MAG: glutamine-hydrolyzing carbamoyl-phosphate synthase small subunit [Bacteroidetes bacterium]|nr:glutamine-hydrolyzing carbamoyl-phosphate synthase small subunit [Bacteroidota bacterium]